MTFQPLTGHRGCKDPTLHLHDMPFFILAPDIDECSIENECHQNATCNNTKGSYNYTCNGRFKGDGKINCTGKILLKCITNPKDQKGNIYLSLSTPFKWIVLQHKNSQFHLLSLVLFSSLLIPSPSHIVISRQSEFHSYKYFLLSKVSLNWVYVYSRMKNLASKEWCRVGGEVDTNRRVNPPKVSSLTFFRWELDFYQLT